MQLSEAQRSRMLSSAVAVVSEYGYGQMTVARVADGARVSRRTFYDLFDDREDCFLAAFDDVVARACGLALAAYGGEQGWRGQVRAGLAALLGFLEEEPGLGSLLVVDALKAGPRVQQRRAEVLARLAGLLQREGSRAGTGRELPPLTGEGVVGAVLGVIHTRLQAKHPGRMIELLNPLMAMIVLPFLGRAVAQKELGHPVPKLTGTPGTATRAKGRGSSTTPGRRSPLEGLPMRVTYRTLRVLTAISEQPGASNREVAAHADVADQGQISKLLARLERVGLIENTGEGQPSGEPNAWRLTPRGKELIQVSSNPLQANSNPRDASKAAQ
jgi:AcrR family transcriptional regulator/DNA-binding MarR family transcriptional regulator